MATCTLVDCLLLPFWGTPGLLYGGWAQVYYIGVAVIRRLYIFYIRSVCNALTAASTRVRPLSPPPKAKLCKFASEFLSRTRRATISLASRVDPPSTCFRQTNITRTATSLSPILPVPGAAWRPVCTVVCCDAQLWPRNGSYCRRCDDRRCMQAGRAVGCCTSEKDAGTRARGELRAPARPCTASHACSGMSRRTQHGAWRLAAAGLVHVLS